MTTDPLTLVMWIYLAMTIAMIGLWALHRVVRNASIADAGFCFGLIAAILWYAAHASGETERKVLVVVMVSLYAGRLGFFILFHRIIGKTEDPRYRRLRDRWGPSESWRMFGYFHLQAVAVALFSLPVLVVIQIPRAPFGFWELAGFLLWIVAVAGETVADRQLTRFREQPWNHDRVCREGLWYFSRHPNYFFEWLQWWSYVVMAIGAPGWPLTWIGPVAMGYALVYVTGIPPAEEQALAHRGEDYRQYQRTTSAFVPWVPKTGRPTGSG